MAMTVTCPGCKASLNVREEYAGKGMQCPRCSASFTVPEAVVLELATEGERSSSRPPPTKLCPHCGERIAASAKKCRYCMARLDAEDEDEDEDYARPYKPCPRCQARGAQRVTFTFWGSFYGPALLSHVRCPECGYGYNGKTGRSNLIPAIIFVSVPALLIVAILAGLFYLLIWSKNP
jgi:hypothetical protein